MALNRYTVKRHRVDFYSIYEDRYVAGKWQPSGSWASCWPESDLPKMAQKRNPKKALRKDGQSYTFYACVWHYPNPAYRHIYR